MNRASAGAGQLSLLELCMDERDRAVLAFARRHQQRRDVGDLVGRELGLSPTRYFQLLLAMLELARSRRRRPRTGDTAAGDAGPATAPIAGPPSAAVTGPLIMCRMTPLREIKSDGSNRTRSSAPRLTWDVRDRGSANGPGRPPSARTGALLGEHRLHPPQRWPWQQLVSNATGRP
jgi:hypothetical protein